MILVDSNVLADVLHQDPVWMEWSAGQLAAHDSRLHINPVIYAELSYRAKSVQEVESILAGFSLRYLELPREALFLAAQAFRLYRKRGGVKTAPLPDFFIGAHAQAAGIPLLTRDITRYQTYFPKVSLIAP
jgi:predicted nucleic acid-binding protein